MEHRPGATDRRRRIADRRHPCPVLATFERSRSHRVRAGYLSLGGFSRRSRRAQWVQDALAKRPDGDLAAVVAFGGNARLDRVLEASSDFDGTAVVVDETATDIASAIRLASAVLPTDAKKRIVLISDGRITSGDALNEAEALGEVGIPIDIRTLDASQSDDAAVSAIDVPSLARVGESIDDQRHRGGIAALVRRPSFCVATESTSKPNRSIWSRATM